VEPSQTEPVVAPAHVARSDGTDVSPASEPRNLPRWTYLLLGVASAVAGLLPWVVSGMRLPLQNLWATETLPGDMPIVLLPFNQYALLLIAALLVTGAAIAGIVTRATRRRRPRFGVTAMLVGVLAVQVVAVAQTTAVVRAGLQDRPESDLYLAALIAVATVSVLVGVLVMLLVATAPKAGAMIGLSIAAVAFGPWCSRLLVPSGSVAAAEIAPLLDVIRWIPAVLVGVAIAWAGVGTVGRVVAAGASLGILWIGPAFITAVANAAGSRVLARDPALMAEYAVEVFGMALTIPSIALPPLIVAVVVAAIGIVGRVILRRSHARRTLTT
jgi:hypothetical protein